MKTYTEAVALKDRIVEEELLHANEVRAYERQAAPIRQRITQAEEDFDATGHPEYAKRARVARLDLANLGPCPVEPLRLGMLRGRLHRLENGL